MQSVVLLVWGFVYLWRVESLSAPCGPLGSPRHHRAIHLARADLQAALLREPLAWSLEVLV